jgi:hypothetical protein
VFMAGYAQHGQPRQLRVRTGSRSSLEALRFRNHPGRDDGRSRRTNPSLLARSALVRSCVPTARQPDPGDGCQCVRGWGVVLVMPENVP